MEKPLTIGVIAGGSVVREAEPDGMTDPVTGA